MSSKNLSKFRESSIGEIPEEWQIKTVEELVTLQILEKPMDGNHGGIHPKQDDYVSVGIPFIMASDINEGTIDLINCKFIKKSQADTLQKGFSFTGDVLLTHKGVIGRTAIVGKIETDYIMLTPQVTYYRIKDKNKLDNRFLKYYFDSKRFQCLFKSWAGSGSTRNYLGITEQRKLPVLLPRIHEQKIIANVLSTLDSKIELNQEMNRTFEAFGEAVFRRWFVDFEFPDEEGKPYKSSGGKMVYNDELEKEIPKGWKVNPIDEIADFLNGLAMQKFPAKENEEFLPVIKIRELRQGITESTDRANLDVPEEYVVSDGDVLFSWSGSLEVVLWGYGKGALNQHLFKVTSSEYPKWFFYYWILKYLPEYRHIASGKATTMGHIRRHHLTNSLVVVPDEKTLKRIDKMFAPIIKKIIAKKIETRTLTQIRDSLLPKLMSGKIRVPITNDSVEVL